MKFLIGMSGISLLAIYGIVASFKIRNVKYKLFLQFLWSLGLLMVSIIPFMLIFQESLSLYSASFWIHLIIGLALFIFGVFEVYKLIHDLIHGSKVQEFQVISTKKIERSIRRGGDYFLFWTSKGISFEIDFLSTLI